MSLAAKITHHTEGENRYIRVWREKTGEQRLKIAMELRRLVLKLAEEGIKNQKPNISSEDLKARIQERIYGFSFPFKKSHQKAK